MTREDDKSTHPKQDLQSSKSVYSSDSSCVLQSNFYREMLVGLFLLCELYD